MLIENEQLNIVEFKLMFDKLSWIRVPRKLGPNHKDFFYIASYEDDKIIVKASVRPSLRMQIFESFKNRTLEGEIPTETYKGKLCEWGSSVIVKIDEHFLNRVKEVSKDLLPTKTQIVSW